MAHVKLLSLMNTGSAAPGSLPAGAEGLPEDMRVVISSLLPGGVSGRARLKHPPTARDPQSSAGVTLAKIRSRTLSNYSSRVLDTVCGILIFQV
ncbi:Glutamate 5-kinase [Clarias magur]|uniref:Glutamate 5-kinase n=1 Tax=Clarias magur TaxID=1594786 RepID=A0A8J4U8P2_CLAMG|nr:Glutamate 5-kinase [Clarias magur]